MNDLNPNPPSEPSFSDEASRKTTRREFLSTSGKVAVGSALASMALPHVHAAVDDTLRIALVGCGGRGTGAAAQALSTAGPTKLWAVADVFPNRLNSSLGQLKQRMPDKADVPPERQFLGMDAYRKAIDSLGKGGVVLLTTPPAFRPLHYEYAVEKDCHVFMEKSFAVDAPGIRRVMKTGEEAARKNLKVAGGLMSRHYKPLEEAIAMIHDGAIGKVITTWAYRMHSPVGLGNRQPGTSELAFQIANYSNFTWLNGSFIVDWLIHNVDVACWAQGGWPISVQGMGGRQVRDQADQLFDHYAAECTMADGTRMDFQARHMTRCHDFWGVVVHGATGCAVLGEGVPQPRIFKGHQQSSANILWQYKGPTQDAYQNEHDLLFDAIRSNKPYNETERCAKSCMTAIMARMACESGQMITWDDAIASTIELAPGIANFTLDSPPPDSAKPDASGHYPIAMPGTTRVI